MSDKVIDANFHEYDRLATECVARIGFRDNLLYVTLAAYEAIISFVMHNGGTSSSGNSTYFGLLVLPWTSVILGWTYLVNDIKVSEIGKYVRNELEPRVKGLIGDTEVALFGWDKAHFSETRRPIRKVIQWLIDETTFVVSGIAALMAFSSLATIDSCVVLLLFWFESALLVCLFVALTVYALPEFKQHVPAA